MKDRNTNSNNYIQCRNLGDFGIILDGNSVRLVQRYGDGLYNRYFLQVDGKKKVPVSLKDVGILLFNDNPEDIRRYVSPYLEKLKK